jgi:dCTP deaminase
LILSDKDFKAEVVEHNIVEPFIIDNLQPCSLDLTLGDKLLIPTSGREYTVHEEVKTFEVAVDDYKLQPNDFVLASTAEWVNIPAHLVGEITGRSSIARMGLEVHLTAGWIDAGFKGNITLEIVNNSDNVIQLKEGARIAQLVLYKLSSPVEQEYNGKYQNSKGVVANKSEEVIVKNTKIENNVSVDVKLNPDDVERDLGEGCESGICPVR